ncbi:unnamed protein product [Cylicocyclus nassatus]|uniref:Uncharacterized protein n=1 Tax=Cylicocyclus nassatus TaxID=53992 RepID=A0AA36M7A3_CYLNA|nr:unnamed protein product [Cylicocyclus nassatus]
MLALQLLVVLPIFVYSQQEPHQHGYRGGPYHAAHWTRKEENLLRRNENMTLGELEQMAQEQEAKRLERLKQEFERREEMNKKVDKMVLEGFIKLVHDYMVYSAIGRSKNMTLREFRAAIQEFNKKYPGKVLYFEQMRREMKEKLAREAYEAKENETKTAGN